MGACVSGTGWVGDVGGWGVGLGEKIVRVRWWGLRWGGGLRYGERVGAHEDVLRGCDEMGC